MTGQMCWLSIGGDDGEKVLHLRMQPSQPWRPYKSFPQYAMSDYKVPGGSKGWATYQQLMKSGWTLVATSAAQPQLLAYK
ncbi:MULTISPECIES: hypothetical protein [Trichocoleus]|uniref:Uncharacterized protein n=1 Tax=Trichocoleus desertorum GB2-A4 TaxID=2933944 RepID=A0ABV0J519_9CYAN|nr:MULTISPECIES: hypothetical protein [unclassified Trichocoleus]MBD1863703.1 hypothetical protein [Trichocoleus sp. FACHB-46]MBD2095245.1 hypothetical protein [Trichocoleus sp. FACHB-591]MBD2121150.1 hypothetical protein [Trichocoleus sp. FACHB-262]